MIINYICEIGYTLSFNYTYSYYKIFFPTMIRISFNEFNIFVALWTIHASFFILF